METEIDIHRIREILPHRYPFLLIDRVLEVVAGERLRALKNVMANEPFFDGHFPHRPVFPGVLIFLTVTCYNLAGDAIRDAMDPKMKV